MSGEWIVDHPWVDPRDVPEVRALMAREELLRKATVLVVACEQGCSIARVVRVQRRLMLLGTQPVGLLLLSAPDGDDQVATLHRNELVGAWIDAWPAGHVMRPECRHVCACIDSGWITRQLNDNRRRATWRHPTDETPTK